MKAANELFLFFNLLPHLVTDDDLNEENDPELTNINLRTDMNDLIMQQIFITYYIVVITLTSKEWYQIPCLDPGHAHELTQSHLQIEQWNSTDHHTY